MHKPRIVLAIISLLFIAPLLLAILMRSSWWDFRPSELSNRGILVEPPVALDVGSLFTSAGPDAVPGAGGWTVVYLHDGECEQACLAKLAEIRQVHLASGRHRPRIALWLLGSRAPNMETASRMQLVYPEFQLLHDGRGTAGPAFAEAGGDHAVLQMETWDGQVFVLDPSANIILAYPPGSDPLDLSEDLDRLLTWSGGT